MKKHVLYIILALITASSMCVACENKEIQSSENKEENSSEINDLKSIDKEDNEDKEDKKDKEAKNNDNDQIEEIETENINNEESGDSRDLTVTEEESLDFCYNDLSECYFSFCSGAGAWETVLTVDKDGCFEGQYHDSDMGDSADDYPNGTIYYCEFSGKFGPLVKIDDLTYTTTIESIEYENQVGNEEIVDGLKWIYTDAYGLDDAETLYFYLPGTKVENLSDDYMSWVFTSLSDFEGNTKDTLDFVGLYNENAKEGFSSYNRISNFLDEYEYDFDYDEYLLEAISSAETQLEMNEVSASRYDYWNGVLTEEIDIIEVLLSAEDFKNFEEEQNEWLTNRDKTMEEAGAEYENASLQSFVISDAGAEYTKERCNELKDYIDKLY